MPGSRDLRRPRGPSTPATDAFAPSAWAHPRARAHPAARTHPQAWDRGFRRAPNSPARSRIGALQVLQLGEYVAEMLAMLAAFAVPGIRSILGSLQRRLGEYLVDMPEPRRMNVGQPRRHAPISH